MKAQPEPPLAGTTFSLFPTRRQEQECGHQRVALSVERADTSVKIRAAATLITPFTSPLGQRREDSVSPPRVSLRRPEFRVQSNSELRRPTTTADRPARSVVVRGPTAAEDAAGVDGADNHSNAERWRRDGPRSKAEASQLTAAVQTALEGLER